MLQGAPHTSVPSHSPVRACGKGMVQEASAIKTKMKPNFQVASSDPWRLQSATPGLWRAFPAHPHRWPIHPPPGLPCRPLALCPPPHWRNRQGLQESSRPGRMSSELRTTQLKGALGSVFLGDLLATLHGIISHHSASPRTPMSFPTTLFSYDLAHPFMRK